MNKFMKFVEEKLQPIAGRLAGERHLKALQSTFLSLVGFLTIGSFALLLISPVLDYTTMEAGITQGIMKGWAVFAGFAAPYLAPIYNVTLGMLSLYTVVGIGFFMAKHYKLTSFLPVALVTASFMIVCCTNEDFTFNSSYLGGSGLFPAIIISVLAIELYRVLVQKKVGYINLGNTGVPEAIADSIGNMVPALLVLLAVSVLSGLVKTITGSCLPDVIGLLLAPITSLIDTPLGFMLLEALVCLFWWFGIHDGFITGPIDTFLMSNFLANTAAYAAGTAATDLPYIVTESFWWSVMMVGGPACLLGLTILCLFSKSKQIRMIGRVGIVPSIFNINEPMLFGLPICYNPILFIPYIIITPLTGLVFYLAMKAGFINKTFVNPSWNMPTPISQFLSTMDIKALFLAVILFVAATLIWYPFFKAYEKQKLAEEALEEAKAFW